MIVFGGFRLLKIGICRDSQKSQQTQFVKDRRISTQYSALSLSVFGFLSISRTTKGFLSLTKRARRCDVTLLLSIQLRARRPFPPSRRHGRYVRRRAADTPQRGPKRARVHAYPPVCCARRARYVCWHAGARQRLYCDYKRAHS